MILGRAVEHAKTQNWFAVMLDFLIVVMGVFVGIEAANWNQARPDRQGLKGGRICTTLPPSW
jgi:hypothetical protein